MNELTRRDIQIMRAELGWRHMSDEGWSAKIEQALILAEKALRACKQYALPEKGLRVSCSGDEEQLGTIDDVTYLIVWDDGTFEPGLCGEDLDLLDDNEEGHTVDADEKADGEDHGRCGMCGGEMVKDGNPDDPVYVCNECQGDVTVAVQINRERFEKRIEALENRQVEKDKAWKAMLG